MSLYLVTPPSFTPLTPTPHLTEEFAVIVTPAAAHAEVLDVELGVWDSKKNDVEMTWAFPFEGVPLICTVKALVFKPPATTTSLGETVAVAEADAASTQVPKGDKEGTKPRTPTTNREIGLRHNEFII